MLVIHVVGSTQFIGTMSMYNLTPAKKMYNLSILSLFCYASCDYRTCYTNGNSIEQLFYDAELLENTLLEVYG